MDGTGKLIDPRPEPASAQPGPGSTEPDQPRHRLGFDLVGSVLIMILLALWLLFSPLVLGYEDEDVAWAQVVCGALIGLFALLRATGVGSLGLAFLSMAVATALFVTGFFLAESDVARWTAWGSAAIAFFLAVVGASAITHAEGTGGRGPSY